MVTNVIFATLRCSSLPWGHRHNHGGLKARHTFRCGRVRVLDLIMPPLVVYGMKFCHSCGFGPPLTAILTAPFGYGNFSHPDSGWTVFLLRRQVGHGGLDSVLLAAGSVPVTHRSNRRADHDYLRFMPPRLESEQVVDISLASPGWVVGAYRSSASGYLMAQHPGSSTTIASRRCAILNIPHAFVPGTAGGTRRPDA